MDAILVVIEESRDRLVRLGVEPERITLVSNTPPRARAEGVKRERPLRDSLTVVYLGMMELTRGVGEVIDAAAILRGSMPGLKVWLIGAGRDLGLLEARARTQGLLDGTVELLGYIPNQRALELVAEADIGIVPHHADEGWDTTIPNKLFDYMAAGLAVVTSDAVPAARVVRETRAGTVFRSMDAQDCARAILDLAEPATRCAAGAAGREAIRSRYYLEADIERLIGAVDRTLVRN